MSAAASRLRKVADLKTDNDARRLAASGAPVRQIMIHGLCHLQADLVARELADWNLTEFSYLFIENVGNLVCPTSWDLGEQLRLTLLSVTEGEDKPLKYPGLFNSSDVAAITKSDLTEACEFDRELALANIDLIRPGMTVFERSSKTGVGVDAGIDCLVCRRESLGEPV